MRSVLPSRGLRPRMRGAGVGKDGPCSVEWLFAHPMERQPVSTMESWSVTTGLVALRQGQPPFPRRTLAVRRALGRHQAGCPRDQFHSRGFANPPPRSPGPPTPSPGFQPPRSGTADGRATTRPPTCATAWPGRRAWRRNASAGPAGRRTAAGRGRFRRNAGLQQYRTSSSQHRTAGSPGHVGTAEVADAGMDVGEGAAGREFRRRSQTSWARTAPTRSCLVQAGFGVKGWKRQDGARYSPGARVGPKGPDCSRSAAGLSSRHAGTPGWGTAAPTNDLHRRRASGDSRAPVIARQPQPPR